MDGVLPKHVNEAITIPSGESFSRSGSCCKALSYRPHFQCYSAIWIGALKALSASAGLFTPNALCFRSDTGLIRDVNSKQGVICRWLASCNTDQADVYHFAAYGLERSGS